MTLQIRMPDILSNDGHCYRTTRYAALFPRLTSATAPAEPLRYCDEPMLIGNENVSLAVLELPRLPDLLHQTGRLSVLSASCFGRTESREPTAV